MPTAVIRIVFDAGGQLSAEQYAAGLDLLSMQGLQVIASPAGNLPERRREIEILAEDIDRSCSVEDYVQLCVDAFGLPAELGVVTFISRGTDEDALGVLDRFGVVGAVSREDNGEDEIVTVTIAKVDSRRVPESRLHTALEAALNCEVRLQFA